MGRVYQETTPAMLARVTAPSMIASVSQSGSLRERRNSRAVDGGEGL